MKINTTTKQRKRIDAFGKKSISRWTGKISEQITGDGRSA